MAYTPKVWKLNDAPKFSDFNHIEQGITEIETATASSVQATSGYVDTQVALYMPADGSKAMTGNLQIGGYNGVTLGNASVGRTSAAPNAITTAAPGGMHVNESPVWTDKRTGYAMYCGSGSINGTAPTLSSVTGYDCSGTSRTATSASGIRLYDAGYYIITLTCSITYSSASSITAYLTCGSMQSSSFNVGPNGAYSKAFSMTWIPGSRAAAETYVSAVFSGNVSGTVKITVMRLN